MRARKIKDIYFGEINQSMSGDFELPLSQLQQVITNQKGKDVAGQFKRLINQIGGKITITTDKS